MQSLRRASQCWDLYETALRVSNETQARQTETIRRSGRAMLVVRGRPAASIENFHALAAWCATDQRIGVTRTMETIEIGASGLTASRIALGTWAIGGWMWGGNTDLDESIRTIRSAIERGITLIDTAPAYGFGRSEEIVGMALSGALRDRAIIATKVGLEWRGGGKVWRNSSP